MSKTKVTAKIPTEMYEVIKREAERGGIGVQQLAGMLLIHGLKDLTARQKEQTGVHTKD